MPLWSVSVEEGIQAHSWFRPIPRCVTNRPWLWDLKPCLVQPLSSGSQLEQPRWSSSQMVAGLVTLVRWSTVGSCIQVSGAWAQVLDDLQASLSCTLSTCQSGLLADGGPQDSQTSYVTAASTPASASRCHAVETYLELALTSPLSPFECLPHSNTPGLQNLLSAISGQCSQMLER